METQSNNPFSYHSEESEAERTASSHAEIPVPESSSMENPSSKKKQTSAAATTMATGQSSILLFLIGNHPKIMYTEPDHRNTCPVIRERGEVWNRERFM